MAPYEADSQLAYLSKEAIVDVVITEDSDLLVFGSHRVLFKMDEFGYGKLIELNDLGKANKVLVVRYIKTIAHEISYLSPARKRAGVVWLVLVSVSIYIYKTYYTGQREI